MTATTSQLLTTLAFALAIAVFAPTAYGAQCPLAKDDDEDGTIEEDGDHFTYESWIMEKKKDGKIRYTFGRCIENRGTKRIWVHWEGILPRSWIKVDDRLLRELGRNSKESEEKDKELWHGAGRDNLTTVETTCWIKEKACKTPSSTASGTSESTASSSSTSFFSTANATTSQETEEQAVQRLFHAGELVYAYDYSEVFLPVDPEDPINSLVQVGIKIVSFISRDETDIQYALYFSFRDTERTTLRNFVANRSNKALVSISFSDQQLQESFQQENFHAKLSIDARSISQWYNGQRRPQFEARRGFSTIDLVVISSSTLLVTDLTGNIVTEVPISYYTIGW